MNRNRLADEISPYLLQHSTNPVDWYPWGAEGRDKARVENKPIFLSIGYSACHWCHVMERESFENISIAAIMNQHFVNIKVDREERPDLDDFFMAFVQLTTGGGGWRMSVFLTPDGKPFFGGTYFPPEDAHGRRGFPFILKAITQTWNVQQQQVLESSTSLPAELQANFAKTGHSAMQRTTPYSAGIVVQMIAEGTITQRGTLRSEVGINTTRYIELLRKRGIAVRIDIC